MSLTINIVIDRWLHEELNKLKRGNESFGDVISRLLDEHSFIEKLGIVKAPDTNELGD